MYEEVPEGSVCFMDSQRICGSDCKAFNKKTEDCKLLERSSTVSRALKQMMSWLAQADPPRIR